MAVKEHVEKLNEGVDSWNEWRQENPDVKPNLREANLREANLRGANLRGANLQGADLRLVNLEVADLSQANLSGADLRGVKVKSTDLSGADLSTVKVKVSEYASSIHVGAKLGEANLRGADLRVVNLEAADLTKANLSEADLTKANLSEADLNGAYLSDAKLGSANLTLAKLEKADVSSADLRQANVQAARLIDADLSGARLEGADLEGAQMGRAKLSDANFTGAILRKADLTNALLAGAVLRGSVLQDVNLSDVDGLRSEQLAGANLSGAKLPEAVAKFDALGIVDEISRNAKRLFTSLLLGCVYAFLTVATTTDVRLVTNSASSPLPIIGTAIPIAGFYWAAPFILMCLYGYFLLYLQRLWESLGRLPAVFPDGTPLDKKAYPWLLNGLIRSHVALLKQDRPEFSRSQTALSVFLAYWVVPLTLVFLWGRYLTRHEWVGTGINVALLVLSIVMAVTLRHKAASALRGVAGQSVPWRKRLKQKSTYISVFATVVLVSGLIWRSELAISGQTEFFRADLVEQDVSTKPPTWTGQKEKETEEIALVKPARLRGANLRGANAFRAFLVKADLMVADLSGAFLHTADLRDARLFDADLRDANLNGADLTRADLSQAFLDSASLREANLSGAVLGGATLMLADLRETLLAGADLGRAYLQGADLTGATGLSADQIKSAHNWQHARYSEDFLQELGLPPDHNEKVREETSRIRIERRRRVG